MKITQHSNFSVHKSFYWSTAVTGEVSSVSPHVAGGNGALGVPQQLEFPEAPMGD